VSSLIVPSPFDELIDPESLDLPGNFCADVSSKPLEVRREVIHSYSESQWRRLMAHYLGFCSLVDSQVGMIVNWLQAKGLYENTVIVYTSDHGDMLGSHGLNHKSFPLHYKEVLNIPLIIRDPESPVGLSDALVSLADLVPTLADLCNVEMSTDCYGRSFAKCLDDPSLNFRESVIAETFCMDNKENGHGTYSSLEDFDMSTHKVNLSIRSRSEKYIFHSHDKDELYLLDDDPDEMFNCISDISNAEMVNSLQKKLLEEISAKPYFHKAVAKTIKSTLREAV